MKKFLLFLFIIIFIVNSCKPDNPVNNETNPFADSTNIKFIHEGKSYEAWGVGDYVGNTLVIFSNGNFKYYSVTFGKSEFEYIYHIEYQGNKSKDFIDSLDNIFLKANFINYNNKLPYDTDSTSIFMWPSSDVTITWRLNVNDNFKKVHSISAPIVGNFKFPIGYEEFKKDLNNQINFIYK